MVTLNEHLLTECEQSLPIRYPPPLGVDANFKGCPFCQEELPELASALRQHLMRDCPGNPRALPRKK